MPTVKYKDDARCELLSTMTGFYVVRRYCDDDSILKTFVAIDKSCGCWCEISLSPVMLDEDPDMAANLIRKAMGEKHEQYHASQTS